MSDELVEIRLYGPMRKQFGKSFFRAVKSPLEAVSAMRHTVPGFTDYMLKHSKPGYRIFAGDDVVPGAEHLHMHTGKKIIRIVPVVRGGGGDNGILYIIIGAIIIYMTWGVATPLVAGAAGGATVGSVGFAIGTSLVLAGVSQLLAPSPNKASSGDGRPENLPSFAFNGAANVSRQGNPVPVCYGRMLVGSQVISAGMNAEQVIVDIPGSGGQEQNEVQLFLDATAPHILSVPDPDNYVSNIFVYRVETAPTTDFLMEEVWAGIDLNSATKYMCDSNGDYTFHAGAVNRYYRIIYNHRVPA